MGRFANTFKKPDFGPNSDPNSDPEIGVTFSSVSNSAFLVKTTFKFNLEVFKFSGFVEDPSNVKL